MMKTAEMTDIDRIAFRSVVIAWQLVRSRRLPWTLTDIEADFHFQASRVRRTLRRSIMTLVAMQLVKEIEPPSGGRATEFITIQRKA